VIVNDGLGRNTGDQAILHAMLASLERCLPGAKITTFPNSDMRRVRQYLAFLRAGWGADLVLFGGGQEIQDQASVAFLVSGLLKIALARLLSKPVMCYAIGVGPVATLAGRALTRIVLNRVDLITVRDDGSRRELETLRVTKPPCIMTADPGLALAPAKRGEIEDLRVAEGLPGAQGPRVAIAPRRWFHYGHHLLPMSLRARLRWPGDKDAFVRLKALLARTADRLIDRHRAQIVFVPMRSASQRLDPGQDDDVVCREIIELMTHRERAYVLKGDHPPAVLKGFLGEMDLVVGMRMHALVLASMMGVPVVGIALAPKFKAFHEMIGQQAYLIPVEAVDLELLVGRIDSALANAGRIRLELESRRAALQELADSNARYVNQLLERVATGAR
jgi:polysaccharide pyruvyl transferase WcaK-like protein